MSETVPGNNEKRQPTDVRRVRRATEFLDAWLEFCERWLVTTSPAKPATTYVNIGGDEIKMHALPKPEPLVGFDFESSRREFAESIARNEALGSQEHHLPGIPVERWDAALQAWRRFDPPNAPDYQWYAIVFSLLGPLVAYKSADELLAAYNREQGR